MNWSIERRLIDLAFAVALALLIDIGYSIYSQQKKAEEAGDWVSHTFQVSENLETLMSSLKDLETSQRGYVITGDGKYLDHYQTAIPQVARQITILRRLTQDNGHQQRRLKDIDKLAHAKIQRIQKIIVIRQRNGRDAAISAVRAGLGNDPMDNLRQTATTMGQEEKQLLAHREAIAASEKHKVKPLLFAGAAISLLLLTIGFILLNREVDRRTRAEAKSREAEETLRSNNLFLEQRIAERTAELRYEKERAQITLESIGDAVITTDQHANIEYLNPVAEKLTGWPLPEAKGQPLAKVFNIVNESSRLPVANPVDKVLQEGIVVGLANHTALIHRDGNEISIEDSAAPIRNRDGSIAGVVMVFHDVTDARTLTRQLEWQASHDRLTGLLNRPGFERCLTEVLNQDKDVQHAVLYLDVDQFKIINDTGGRKAGDELLKQLASLFGEMLHETGVVARFGEDEFGVLLNNCPLCKAQTVAEQILKTVRTHRFHWEDKQFQTTISAGLFMTLAADPKADEILAAANQACYLAKENGRNRVHVYHELDEHLIRRHREMQWVNQISKALTEKRLHLYCQRIRPIQNNTETDHFEVLMRMQTVDGKIVTPAAFIPAAERYGLMPSIDRYVIEALFTFLAQHAFCNTGEDGTEIKGRSTFAVNLSGASISDKDLLDFIQRQFQQSSISPQAISFEITETAAIANLDQAVAFINALRAIGCRFALDDFGSGLSSFSYLKKFPVDYLKIDGSFVRDILDDPINLAMVRAIHDIGHVMGIKTIAEFIENDAILEQLKAIGVDYGQGYGIHHPEPLIDIVGRLDQ